MLKLLFLYGCGFQQKKNPKLCFFKLLNVTLFFFKSSLPCWDLEPKLNSYLLGGIFASSDFQSESVRRTCPSHYAADRSQAFSCAHHFLFLSISNLEKSVGVRKWWFLYLDGTHAQRNPPPLCSWCASGFKDFKVVKQTGWRKTQRHTSSSNFIGCSFLQLKSVS